MLVETGDWRVESGEWWWLGTVEVTVTKLSLWHLQTPVLSQCGVTHHTQTDTSLLHYFNVNQRNRLLVSICLFICDHKSIQNWNKWISTNFYENNILKQKYWSSFIHFGNYLVDRIKRFSMKTCSCSQHPDRSGKPVWPTVLRRWCDLNVTLNIEPILLWNHAARLPWSSVNFQATFPFSISGQYLCWKCLIRTLII